MEVGNSIGYAKDRANGCNVGNMNVQRGGSSAAKYLCDAILTDDGLGPAKARLNAWELSITVS